MTYHVQVGYEAGVYYVLSSDIPGLNIESSSFEDFCNIAADVAPDLLQDRRAGSRIDFQREKVFA